MQRLTLLIILLLFRGMSCISQDSVFVLHPVVGHFIDSSEKTYYLLFPEISSAKFDSGYIKPAGDQYCLVAHLLPDSMLVIQLDTTDIQIYKTNIDKLYAYYSGLLKIDSLSESEKVMKIIEIKNGGSTQMNNNLLNPAIIETIDNEVRIDGRLRDDAEIRRLWKQGSNVDNGELYIDFDYLKKKK